MYFRDVKQKFKPNQNFTTNRGLLYCYLNDNKMNVRVINISEQQNDDDLDLHQIYQKYKTLIEDDIYIAIMQYFQIDQNGQEAQEHLFIVQQELKKIKEHIKEKKC